MLIFKDSGKYRRKEKKNMVYYRKYKIISTKYKIGSKTHQSEFELVSRMRKERE